MFHSIEPESASYLEIGDCFCDTITLGEMVVTTQVIGVASVVTGSLGTDGILGYALLNF